MMRRDYTVKPGFAAFATLVDKLGGAEPEGEIEPGEGIKGIFVPTSQRLPHAGLLERFRTRYGTGATGPLGSQSS